MPDFSYIDQVFDNANPGASASEEDARAVDNLFRQGNEEEEQKKQQAQQPKKPDSPGTDPGRVAGRSNNVQRGGMDMIQGATKWIEENVGIPLEDIVDNVFQGDQRTPDQVAKDRAGRRENLGQQLEGQRSIEDLPEPIRGPAKVGIEVGRTVAGGLTGAAESALNTAEILGDTAKYSLSTQRDTLRYFATLGNVAKKDNPFDKDYQAVSPDQNPFSNKYEWASWDLGKSTIGAETGVGKVAQGFLEFGMLMAATGGFGNLPAAGAKFAAATSTLGKVGVVAKAGAYGAAAGVAADMMSATRGEGNLSNLIKEYAPEWYPTWLTALAVDEDDSPWEAMLKTGLEGMGIGFAADAVGAFISGSRAARRVMKAGGSEEEAAEAAIKEAQEVIELTTPASSGPLNYTKPTTPEEYVQALEAAKASDPAQYWSVDGIDLDSASKGQVITVEGGAGLVGPDGDIKGVFKDPNSARKGVADEILQAAVRQGGIKLDNFDGYLTRIYERNGFRQVGRMPFNADYAPPGWDEALHGRPDVVAMIYDPKGLVDMSDEARSFNDYDAMIHYRDSLLRSNPQLRAAKDQFALGYSTARLVTPLPNGNRVEWSLMQDRDVITAYSLPPETKALEVQWRMGGGDELIQNYGRRVYTDFQRIAREELEPGTILFNSPAADHYSRGGASAAQARRAGVSVDSYRQAYLDTAVDAEMRSNMAEFWDTASPADRSRIVRLNNLERNEVTSIRERIYTRAGFGPVNDEGIQAAVVRSSPDGRGRWLDPIMDFNDPDGITSAINSQRHYLKRADDLLRTLPRPDAVQRLSDDMVQETYTQYRNLYPDAPADDIPRIFASEHNGLDPWQDMANTQWRAGRIREAQQAAYREDSRHAALQNLISQAQRGIPVTWDDAAAVVPDMFTPGARQLDELPDLTRLRIERAEPGLPTFLDPVTGQHPAGYAIAIDGKELRGEITPEDLDAFIADNMALISREDVALKVTANGDGPELVEIVRIVAEQDEARFLGELFDQPSIHDAGLMNEIPLGGADSLRGTQGQHLASRFGTPMESRTVTPAEAVAQQTAARSNPEARGSAQRMVTDAQLRQIARAVGDEPTRLLRNMVRNNPINLEELSHLSKMSEAEVLADAVKGIQEALGVAGEIDFDKILRMNVDGEELLSRAGIVQVRGLMQEVTSRLYDSAYNIMKAGEVGMDAFPQVERMAEDLKSLMRIHKVSANTYSHLLSDYKIKVPLLGMEIENPFKPPSVETIAQEIKNADKALDEIVRGLSTGDAAAKQQAWRLANALMLSDGDPSKMPSLWKNIRQLIIGEHLSIMYNSLLDGPKTHLVNSLSNAINTVYRPLTAFVGGDEAIKKSAAAGFYNFHKSLGESLQMAYKTLKDGPIDDGSKGFVLASETKAKLEILHRAAEVSTDLGFKAGVGYLDMVHKVATFPLFSWPTRLLATEDAFFKTLTARMEFNSRTMMDAISEAAGTSKPVDEVFKNLLEKNLDSAFDKKTGAILDPMMMAAAKDVTFQTDLEGPIKAFADFVNAAPVMRAFFPFVKTGHDVTVYAVSHAPFLNRFLSEYKTAMAGDDAYLKAIYQGREAFGRMLVLSGAAAALSGNITGNGPSDPEAKKLWLTNHAPRSFKVGDKWVDYSRIEPFGQILSGVADLVYMLQSGQLSEDRARYMAGYLSYAIAANFTNKSTMAGVTPLARLLQPGRLSEDALLKSVMEIGNNMLPSASGRRTFSNMMTPYKQEFNTLVDQLLYTATGGLARNGATAYDWLTAEPIANPSGGANAINPLAVHKRGTNKVKDALEDIEYDSNAIIKSITGVKLDGKHRSRLQQLMGQSGLEKELEAWVTHPSFKPAVAEFQQKLRGGDRVHKENEIFYNEITRIIEKYRDQALVQVKREFPELQSKIIEEKLIRNEQRRPTQAASQIDFENLVTMPLK